MLLFGYESRGSRLEQHLRAVGALDGSRAEHRRAEMPLGSGKRRGRGGGRAVVPDGRRLDSGRRHGVYPYKDRKSCGAAHDRSQAVDEKERL